MTRWLAVRAGGVELKNFTFFEAVDKTAALGLHAIEAFEGQHISQDGDAKIAADLPDPLIARVREKLRSSGVTLTSLYIHTLPGDPVLDRKAFTFGRKLGIETIVSEPAPSRSTSSRSSATSSRSTSPFTITRRGSHATGIPKEVLKVVEGRSRGSAACVISATGGARGSGRSTA